MKIQFRSRIKDVSRRLKEAVLGLTRMDALRRHTGIRHEDGILSHYVIFYDIRDPRRLNRVAKILTDYGTRLQRSFFEAELTESDLQAMKARLRKAADPEKDGIKIMKICDACLPKRMEFGRHSEFEAYAPWKIL
ncbi:MAG: CRISPR-associated endonuclease Cas2 [Desulfovibrio sp.]|nr:CRISPR-associated endonuclease Cas2 [Desulfovibrio sp.]